MTRPAGMTVNCASEDHVLHPAVARLFWPDGHCKPVAACSTELGYRISNSLAEGHAVEVWPLAKGPDNPLRFGQWRSAPDCDRCKDTGRWQENGADAHCGCKRGRRMSELWYASKHGYGHPDEPEPEPDYENEAPF